jgi:hypothetical protein
VSRTGEEEKSWLLDIKKYFQIYDYSSNMKVRMAIYNLKGKYSIWWKYLNLDKGIKDKKMECEEFKKYFKKEYLSKSYYERKTKEFYELKLGKMSMEDLITNFLELLRFAPYIKDEKVKFQMFLICLPHSYKDIIEFDNPKKLNEVLRKDRICYEQYKRRSCNPKTWRGKKLEKLNQR